MRWPPPRTWPDHALRIARGAGWTSRDPTTQRTVLHLHLERGLLLFVVLLAATGILTALSASFGLFRLAAPLLVAAWAGLLAVLVAASVARRVRVRGDAYDLAALAIAALAFLSAGILHHDYYASHSDVGFYVSDALTMAQTGGRTLHGPYDHTLPGFETLADGSARISAMFGYSSLGALFAYLGGLTLLPWLNAPLAAANTLLIYAASRRLKAKTGALLAAALYATSLLTVWFGRWLMTENLATTLFWATVLLATPLRRGWTVPRAAALGLVLLFAALVRLELILFAAWTLLVLAAANAQTLRRRLQSAPRAALYVGLGLLVVAAGSAVALRDELPAGYMRASLELLGQFSRLRAAADAPDVPTTGPGPNWGDYALRYEWDSAQAYGLHWILLAAIGVVAAGIAPRRRSLAYLLLAAPYLLFVLMPPVTTQHPWFMRRLWVALIPLLYVVAGAGLDLRRAGYRWPYRGTRGPEPRVAAVVAASLVAGLLLFVQIDVTAPVAMRQESDGSRGVVQPFAERIDDDAVLIIDLNLVAYAGAFRFDHDVPVVAWFQNPKASFTTSLLAADRHEHAYLLRVNTSRDLPFLLPDADGVVATHVLEARFASPPRSNFRDYLSRPPLEDGYGPLAAYLRSDVPPNGWERSKYEVALVEARRPLVLQHNVVFAPQEWTRTEQGMEAVEQPSRLLVDLAIFKPAFREEVAMRLYVAYHQTEANRGRVLTAIEPDGPKPLEPDLPSDGSGRLHVAGLPFPKPLRAQAIEVPQGVVLRGIYLGVDEGP